jgi:NAD(P)H-hydrate epimerase
MAVARSATPPPIDGCRPLFASAAVRQADRRAVERHRIPSILLMDRAALAAAQEIARRHPVPGRALVVCGSGNNGGDGYAVARHLADDGWHVEIATPRGHRPATPDAMTMAATARSLGLRPRVLTAAKIHEDTVVVDALLGTGARGAPQGPVGEAVALIAAHRGPVVALDVPSGVDADCGEVAGDAVRADLTVTFHGDKPGLHLDPGRRHAGEVVVADIGIPAEVVSAAAAWLAGPEAGPVPARSATADKYAAGAVLVIAGSPGLTGAGILCARATLRAGAGLTVAAVPAAVQPVFAAAMAEVMSAPIPDVDGRFTHASLDRVVAEAARVGAVAIGPGLGRTEATTAFVHAVLDAVDLPTVIDADGLWHLGRRPGMLARRGAPVVLTPHAGEAARLLGVRREEVEAARLSSARRLADRANATVVLKGPGTVTVSPEGDVVVDGAGTAALATAGSGDVLTGIVTAFLARGMAPPAAAATAVAVHARAGIVADRGDGTVAGDLVEALPEAAVPA